MNKYGFKQLVSTIAIAAAVVSVNVHADGSRFHHQNPAGGITAGAKHSGSGANGSYANGHTVVTDGAGNGDAKSSGEMTTANGGTAARSGKTSVASDGSASHDSSFSASGAQGSIDSQGSASKASDGTISQSRTTNAAGANGSYQGTTSYNSGTGVSHTATCTNASGQTVSCPR